MHVETVMPRFGHGDFDAVAGLLGVHVNRGHVLVVASALLDDHLHIGAVPRTNLDRAIESGQRHVGLAGHGELFLVALDVPDSVDRADDVDASRCRQ